jgi:hypothetical protein
VRMAVLFELLGSGSGIGGVDAPTETGARP